MQEKPQPNLVPRLGMTHGDINGIAYEVLLKAFADARILTLLTPVLYGQSKVLSYYKKNFGIEEFNYSLTRDARQAWAQKFNIINIVDRELKIDPGQSTPLSAEMSALSLKMAVEDLHNEYIDALVMLPTCLSVNQKQPDLLASIFGHPDMLRVLVSDFMRVGLATDDIPLRDAMEKIDTELVVRKLGTLSKALKSDFGMSSPKIAVLGLNPHAGEMGNANENDPVVSGIAEAQKQGMYAFGPFSSEQFFVSGSWKKYDAVLAMTYEQGVLPFKLISVNGGAYYWAGLPTVCTAPFYGPGFDIANTNQASPDALRQAIYLAMDIVKQKKEA
jgi:4-hydroxythreonine-4-phosphate dehydrogenase